MTRAAAREASFRKNVLPSSAQTAGNRDAKVEHDDQGEYYIRRYRRESRTPTGGVEVVQVRDYVYWPPERRRASTYRPSPG